MMDHTSTSPSRPQTTATFYSASNNSLMKRPATSMTSGGTSAFNIPTLWSKEGQSNFNISHLDQNFV